MSDILTVKMGRPPKPLTERFWSRVSKAAGDGCWEWTGSLRRGYGQISPSGSQGDVVRTHRLSWEMHNGAIPAGAQVLHHCDNPLCVRPDHLFLGNSADNMRDKVAKGRQHRPFGIKNGAAKLTPSHVRDIRAAYSNGRSQTKIAGEFGVSQTLVSAVVRRKVWAHV